MPLPVAVVINFVLYSKKVEEDFPGMNISSPDAASEDRLLDTGIADPASDLEAPRRKAPLLEIGVVESGEDQTYKCPLCQVSMLINFFFVFVTEIVAK